MPLRWVAVGREMLDGPHSRAARSAQRWPHALRTNTRGREGRAVACRSGSPAARSWRQRPGASQRTRSARRGAARCWQRVGDLNVARGAASKVPGRSQPLRPLPTGRGELADRAAALARRVRRRAGAAPRCRGRNPLGRAVLRRGQVGCPGVAPHAPVRPVAMSYKPTQAGIGALPRGAVGWRLARIRAARRRRRLDAALAEGADPWSAGELMVRAARLGSYAERRKIAAGLDALLDLAALQQRRSSNHMVRPSLSWSIRNRCARSPSGLRSAGARRCRRRRAARAAPHRSRQSYLHGAAIHAAAAS
jgi:hypothetical protein